MMLKPQATLVFSLTAILVLAACSPPVSDDYAERMSREHATDTPVASPAADEDPTREVVSEEVVYADLDGTLVTGYLARPAGMETGPGVLVIQEWWGLNDNIRAMADRFAGEGYIALAVDLYEGEVAEDRDNAYRLMQAAMETENRVEENLRQAHTYLTTQARAIKVGSVGWCFGGGWSLRAGLLLGASLDATVMYYGRVVTDPDELASLSAPLLGHFGSEDQGIPIASVRELESSLNNLGKPVTIHVYEGAGHAFANPSGRNYQKEAADQAWERTLAFFAQHLV